LTRKQGEFFTHRRKFAPMRVRAHDPQYAVRVLLPVDLASFSRQNFVTKKTMHNRSTGGSTLTA